MHQSVKKFSKLFVRQNSGFKPNPLALPFWWFGTVSTTMDLKSPRNTSAFQFPIKSEINAYKTINKNFDEEEFIEGAKVAHEVVVDLLFQKNLEPLEDMLTEECFEAVTNYFDDLEEKNQTMSGELISINSTQIASIYIREHEGKIDTYVIVKYETTDQGCLTDESGKLLQGSEEPKDRVHHWIFKNENDSWKISSFIGKANMTDFK
eukprot:gene738-8990_t